MVAAGSEVLIVHSEPHHIESFHQCLDRVAKERRYLGFVEAPSAEQVAAFRNTLIEEGGVQFVAVAADGRVVGWCDIMRYRLEGFRHTGGLGMGLLPEFRGRGIGRRIAEAAVEAAFARGMERIQLEVFASNEIAIALYERMGFAREGLKRRARVLDGVAEDVVTMALLRESR